MNRLKFDYLFYVIIVLLLLLFAAGLCPKTEKIKVVPENCLIVPEN